MAVQTRCEVFATNYNPEGLRLGNKVLRQRLRGPALASYYPRKATSIAEMKKTFGPQLTTWDDAEEDRFEYIDEYEPRHLLRG
jgi:small subunit ribosomal protein S33